MGESLRIKDQVSFWSKLSCQWHTVASEAKVVTLSSSVISDASYKIQWREQLLTHLILRSMISASQPGSLHPSGASPVHYHSLFSVTDCVKISSKGKTWVCLVSGTSCFLALLIWKYTRQACLDKKVDINIPNKRSFTFFFIICVPLVNSWEDCCLSAHLL